MTLLGNSLRLMQGNKMQRWSLQGHCSCEFSHVSGSRPVVIERDKDTSANDRGLSDVLFHEHLLHTRMSFMK